MRILTLCALLPAMGAWAQTSFQTLVVNTTDGQVHTYAVDHVDSLTFTTEPSVQQQKWYHMLENPGVADYLRDFAYDATDYTYHRLFDYRGEPYLDARQDWPYGVTLGDTTYYNLIPGRSYTLQYVPSPSDVGAAIEPPRQVTIHTLGQLRQIRTEGIDNVRDLGGWPTADGGHVAYARLYRGTELNTCLSPTNAQLRSPHRLTAADVRLLREELGIGAELDLRALSEIPTPGLSALGPDIAYAQYPISYTDVASAGNQALLVSCLHFISEQLSLGQAVYIHCIWGADRTGALCMLLEGLLGVSQSDLDKDYELTSFGGNTRYRTNSNYRHALQSVLSKPGETQQKKFRTWWLDAGATDAELDKFLQLMQTNSQATRDCVKRTSE